MATTSPSPRPPLPLPTPAAPHRSLNAAGVLGTPQLGGGRAAVPPTGEEGPSRPEVEGPYEPRHISRDLVDETKLGKSECAIPCRLSEAPDQRTFVAGRR
jgi:hypothetical protein